MKLKYLAKLKVRFLISLLVISLILPLELIQAQERIEVRIIKELNIARSDPAAYGDRIEVELEYDRVPAMRIDDLLTLLAISHATEMAKKKDLYHSDMIYSESILWNYDPMNSIRQFVIDKGVPSLVHRDHMFNGHTLVGIGISKAVVDGYTRHYVCILTSN